MGPNPFTCSFYTTSGKFVSYVNGQFHIPYDSAKLNGPQGSKELANLLIGLRESCFHFHECYMYHENPNRVKATAIWYFCREDYDRALELLELSTGREHGSSIVISQGVIDGLHNK